MKTTTVMTDRDLPADVIQAIEQGRKIEAIKRLREQTGLGLANAKVLVDRAASRHAKQAPALVEEVSNLPGLVRTLLLVAAGFALYHLFFAA